MAKIIFDNQESYSVGRSSGVSASRGAGRLEQATSRALAAELRCPPERSGYGVDFDEVLVQAYGIVFGRTSDRIAERSSGCVACRRSPPCSRTCSLCPRERRDEASVVVSFWGRVPHNRSLGESTPRSSTMAGADPYALR